MRSIKAVPQEEMEEFLSGLVGKMGHDEPPAEEYIVKAIGRPRRRFRGRRS